MADPSMTKEEFYVATSRTREETYLYATPEVNFERDEYAPRSAAREGLDHIAEAAERVGAQRSAHDEALRSRYAELDSPELVARLGELRSEARAEAQNQEAHRRYIERSAENQERSERVEADREQLPEPRRFERGAERREREAAERDLGFRERHAEIAAERLAADAAELAEVRHEARAEEAVITSVLAERERLAAAAARLSPPDHITKELGERPSDPAKAREWDKAVHGIESYRQRNGVVDRDSALGTRPKDHSQAHEHERAQRQIDRAQRQLERSQRQAQRRQ
jgi:hypothetical protein